MQSGVLVLHLVQYLGLALLETRPWILSALLVSGIALIYWSGETQPTTAKDVCFPV